MKNGSPQNGLDDRIRRLTAERRQYRKIFEAMGHAVSVYKPNGTLVLMNSKAAEILSGQPDDFIGQHIGQIIPEYSDIILHRLQSVARTGRSESHEDEMNLPIGMRCFDASYAPIFAEAGHVHLIEITAVDVTARKRTEKELLDKKAELTDAEQILKDLNETMDLAQKMAGIGYWSYDARSGKRTWSDQMYTIFGCDPALGPPKRKQLSRTWHPEDFATYIDAFRNALKGHGYSITVRVRHPDGEMHYINTQGYPRYDHKGAVIGLLGTSQDVTERKRAEDKLRQSEQKYRNIFENAVEGFFQSTPEGRFISVNPAFARMLRYGSPDELVNAISDISTQYYVNAEDRRRYRQLLDKDGSVEGFEFQARCKDGQTIWVSNSTRAYFDDDGQVIHYEGIVIDITERKQAEAERELLQSQLLQARKMESLGTLSGGIAHEFNNILGIILGNSELAGDDIPESNTANAYLQEIKKASLRGKEIVSQLLSFSRKSEHRKKPVSLSSLASDSIGLLRAAIPANIVFTQHIDRQCDTILGNPTQLHQVMINLCTNAAHAMEDNGGQLTIRVANVETHRKEAFFDNVLEPGRYVCLEVRDTGIGIPDSIRERIFDPFYSTKTVGKGSGMGLTVVLGIVSGHDGGIRITSTAVGGTVVQCYFPAIDAQPDTTAPLTASLPKGNASILLVDDEVALARLVQLRLERLGYTVTMTNNPVDALDRYRSTPHAFDLVIVDMAMPEMNGDRLIKAILEVDDHAKTIICTGYSDRMDATAAKAIGASAFLMKPIDQETLATVIRDVLDAP